MANILLPTSKAQVSGYKFLMRRAQHGVVLGDIRMIHDPLARRHRALYAGAAMATVLGLGAGAMAVLNPAINPGEAPIVASESGALYVRIDATLHPVQRNPYALPTPYWPLFPVEYPWALPTPQA